MGKNKFDNAKASVSNAISGTNAKTLFDETPSTKKVGRPKTLINKAPTLSIYVTEEIKSYVELQAHNNWESVSQYVCRLIRNDMDKNK